MESAATELLRRTHRTGQANRADPTEIPTNIGILITVGVVFVLLFGLCLQDHRKRARITDAYKSVGQFS